MRLSREYDIQAVELNSVIERYCPSLMDMLSERGKAIYFPKLGILSQSAAARGKKINATIGVALEDDASPMCLETISERVSLPPNQVFSYSPSFGLAEARSAWKRLLLLKNPSLEGKSFSLPLVTSALTHGLSVSGYLFCDEGDKLILPDLYWENYELVFGLAFGAELDSFQLFDDAGRFNAEGLREKLDSSPGKKKIVCLNFPNNPVGYTPSVEEVFRIKEVLLDAAQRGAKIVVLIDDAYFGLVYEEGVYEQSSFCELCDLHPNILAVKLDGPTKEDYAWGLRVGFITFGIAGGTAETYTALEAKTAGAVRGSISNACTLSQSLLIKSWESGEYATQSLEKRRVLKKRYDRVKSILMEHPEYKRFFVALPFNSGYFMCVKLVGVDARKLHAKLLNDYSTGVIVLGDLVRIAFSSVPEQQLDSLFENMYNAAHELAGQSC